MREDTVVIDRQGVETLEVKFDTNSGWTSAVEELLTMLVDSRRGEDSYSIPVEYVMSVLERECDWTKSMDYANSLKESFNAAT